VKNDAILMFVGVIVGRRGNRTGSRCVGRSVRDSIRLPFSW